MTKPKLVLLTLIVVILAIIAYQAQLSSDKPQLTIGNKTKINVTLARTPAEHEKGYSNHPSIGFNEGLLFVFDRVDRYPFWMKDMLFDLDFIMINDQRVVEIHKTIKAPINNQGQMEYVNSSVPFDQLLEVKAGFSDRFKIAVGDQVALDP